MVEEFIKQAGSIAIVWQATLNEYNNFRQEMTTIVPELGP